jgi:hypothetical protein
MSKSRQNKLAHDIRTNIFYAEICRPLRPGLAVSGVFDKVSAIS